MNIFNVKHLSLRIKIIGSPYARPNQSVLIHLNGKEKSVSPTTQDVVFDNIDGGSADFFIQLNGYTDFDYYHREGSVARNVSLLGILPIKISRQIVGAGVIVVPVVPVQIVYAPLLDNQRKNIAYSGQSETSGNTTSISFKNSNGKTNPAPSTFQSTIKLQSEMSTAGSAYQVSLIPMRRLLARL